SRHGLQSPLLAAFLAPGKDNSVLCASTDRPAAIGPAFLLVAGTVVVLVLGFLTRLLARGERPFEVLAERSSRFQLHVTDPAGPFHPNHPVGCSGCCAADENQAGCRQCCDPSHACPLRSLLGSMQP